MKGGSDRDNNPFSITFLCRKIKLCPCALLADVASSEQQQTAKASGQDQEEEEIEDILMDTEEELMRAEDTEQLKPEAVQSETAATSGESLVSRLVCFLSSWTVIKSSLFSFLF